MTDIAAAREALAALRLTNRPGRGCVRDVVDAALAALGRLERDVDAAERFLRGAGFVRCDIPSCNCGAWHGGHASERLGEIREALESAGFDCNGKTTMGTIRDLIGARAKTLVEAADLVAGADDWPCPECADRIADWLRARAEQDPP